MDLKELRILHLSKKSVKSPQTLSAVCFPVLPGAFQLETCQRWLFVSNAESFAQLPGSLFEEKSIKVY
jgi:hypothetical protein